MLKTGGIYVAVSYGYPSSRMMHFVGLVDEATGSLGLRRGLPGAAGREIELREPGAAAGVGIGV